jgi:hypothetical protein
MPAQARLVGNFDIDDAAARVVRRQVLAVGDQRRDWLK